MYAVSNFYKIHKYDQEIKDAKNPPNVSSS